MMMMHGLGQLQNGPKRLFKLTNEVKYDVIVIGAGISGLSAAYKAKKAGKSVLLLEKEPNQGGVIQTQQTVFGNFEIGPNSFALNKETLSLIQELGLENEIIYANTAAQKRYIFLNGKPTLINPKKLLFSSEILSIKGRIKLLTERFKKVQSTEGETLAAAVRRRFSDEILQTLVNPIISGIYAGDAEKLEYKSSMKKLYQFEQEFGSFTKGFLQSKKKGETRKVVTFKNGLQQLTDALAKNLENDTLHEAVSHISIEKNEVQVMTSAHHFIGKEVIMATPAFVTGELLKPLHEKLASNISAITYPSLLSIQLAFDKNKVKSHLDAFGLLIPKQANKVTLGIINYSSVFAHHPEHHQYNLFVAVKEKITEGYIERLIALAQSELKDIYQIDGDASYLHHKVWHKAIPQFNVGHADLMEEVNAFERNNPSIKIIGNWRTGVAIGDCI